MAPCHPIVTSATCKPHWPPHPGWTGSIPGAVRCLQAQSCFLFRSDCLRLGLFNAVCLSVSHDGCACACAVCLDPRVDWGPCHRSTCPTRRTAPHVHIHVRSSLAAKLSSICWLLVGLFFSSSPATQPTCPLSLSPCSVLPMPSYPSQS
jgi:hypothetical protein